MESYLCDTCGDVVTKSDIENHCRNHTQYELLTCDKCPAVFSRKERYQDHVRTHDMAKSQLPTVESVSLTTDLEKHCQIRPFTNDKGYDERKTVAAIKTISVETSHLEALLLKNRGEVIKEVNKAIFKAPLPDDEMSQSCIQDSNKTKVTLLYMPVYFEIPQPEKEVNTPPPRTTKKKRTPYKLQSLCDICGRIFTTPHSLQVHFLIHTKSKPFVCEVCGKRFPTKHQLRGHNITHTGEKRFECPSCNKKLRSRSSMKFHRCPNSESLDKSFMCIVCGRKLSSAGSLKDHMRTHTNDSRFSCDTCQKTFNHKIGFKRHVCIKNSEKKAFSCKSCDGVFLGTHDLRKHYRNEHKNEKNMKCHLCPKTFYNDFQLKSHVRSHEVRTEIKCGICSKVLKGEGNLKIHLRTHTGEKPYRCDVCGKTFSQISARNGHRLIHENKKPYSCQFCDKAFRQSTCLTKHCRDLHPDEVD